MSEQDDPQGDPAPENDPKPDEPLGEGGIKALNAEREARETAEKSAKKLQEELDAAKQALAAAQNADQPEWQQKFNDLQAKLDAEVAARQEAEKKSVAAERTQHGVTGGLPLAVAKKLTGATPEEWDAEIAELLPHFGPAGPRPNPQQGNPSQGRGGTLSAGRDLYKQQHPAKT